MTANAQPASYGAPQPTTRQNHRQIGAARWPVRPARHSGRGACCARSMPAPGCFVAGHCCVAGPRIRPTRGPRGGCGRARATSSRRQQAYGLRPASRLVHIRGGGWQGLAPLLARSYWAVLPARGRCRMPSLLRVLRAAAATHRPACEHSRSGCRRRGAPLLLLHSAACLIRAPPRAGARSRSWSPSSRA